MSKAEIAVRLAISLSLNEVINMKDEENFVEIATYAIKTTLFDEKMLWAVKEYIRELEKEDNA